MLRKISRRKLTLMLMKKMKKNRIFLISKELLKKIRNNMVVVKEAKDTPILVIVFQKRNLLKIQALRKENQIEEIF